MTERHTELSLAALKEIAAGVDRTLAVFDRFGSRLRRPDEETVHAALLRLRRELAAQIARHPDNPGHRP